MNTRYAAYLCTLLLLLFAVGCDLLDDNDPQDLGPFTAGVLVANQGNFGDGNGSVTLYDPDTDDASEVVSNIGSIVQSIAIVDERLYVTANTGNRVDSYSLDGFSQVGQSDVPAPRYLAWTRTDEAYVTSQTWDRDPTVQILDLAQDAVIDSLTIGGVPEGLTRAGDRLYVAAGGFSMATHLEVVDVTGQSVLDPIDIDCYSRILITDQDDEVFAFCNTEADEGEAVILGGADGTIIDRLALGGRVFTAGPGQDAFFAADANEVYVVLDEDRVARINTLDNEIVDVLGPFDGDPIGAVAYDALEERLYLGRVPGFDEAGTVTIHERDGTQVGSFSAGVAPTYITFLHSSE